MIFREFTIPACILVQIVSVIACGITKNIIVMGGVRKRLEQGILDVAFFVTPSDTSQFKTVYTGLHERWGIILPKNDPLAGSEYIIPEDLREAPLIISRQTLETLDQNDVEEWFGCKFNELNIAGTFNLAYNAGFMIRNGQGYCLAFDNLIDYRDDLCFRPLYPELMVELKLAWKKDKHFSGPAEILLNKLLENIDNTEKN